LAGYFRPEKSADADGSALRTALLTVVIDAEPATRLTTWSTADVAGAASDVVVSSDPLRSSARRTEARRQVARDSIP
jgi:hypothetical protein